MSSFGLFSISPDFRAFLNRNNESDLEEGPWDLNTRLDSYSRTNLDDSFFIPNTSLFDRQVFQTCALNYLAKPVFNCIVGVVNYFYEKPSRLGICLSFATIMTGSFFAEIINFSLRNLLGSSSTFSFRLYSFFIYQFFTQSIIAQIFWLQPAVVFGYIFNSDEPSFYSAFFAHTVVGSLCLSLTSITIAFLVMIYSLIQNNHSFYF